MDLGGRQLFPARGKQVAVAVAVECVTGETTFTLNCAGFRGERIAHTIGRAAGSTLGTETEVDAGSPSETVPDTAWAAVTSSLSKGALGIWRFQGDARTQSRNSMVLEVGTSR